MRGFRAAGLGLVLVLGCTDDESTETLTSFGSASESGPVSTTSDATSSMSDPSEASTSPDSTGGAGTVTSAATSDPTGESTSESTSDPTSDPTSDSGSSSSSGATSGSGGDGDLGECVGLGAWASCSQYCEAIVEVCIEGGCDGATAVYFDDAQACIDQSGGAGSNQDCNEGFDQSGGASFARCCCG